MMKFASTVETPSAPPAKPQELPPAANERPAVESVGIPDILDKQAQRPTPGVLRISQQAIESRMRRIFTPNVKGEFKVSAEIVQQWKGKKKGRKSLEQLFQSCGFDTDWFSNC